MRVDSDYGEVVKNIIPVSLSRALVINVNPPTVVAEPAREWMSERSAQPVAKGQCSEVQGGITSPMVKGSLIIPPTAEDCNFLGDFG